MDIIWTFHLFVPGLSIEVSREGLNGLVAVNFEYFDGWWLLLVEILSKSSFRQINVIFCIN